MAIRKFLTTKTLSDHVVRIQGGGTQPKCDSSRRIADWLDRQSLALKEPLLTTSDIVRKRQLDSLESLLRLFYCWCTLIWLSVYCVYYYIYGGGIFSTPASKEKRKTIEVQQEGY